MAYPLGQTVRIAVDRPLGSRHPRYPQTVYPVNYGYVPGTRAGDGQPQDVYILGVAEPVTEFVGVVIAVIRRADDAETKWVAAPAGCRFSAEEILRQTYFQERYFRSELAALYRPDEVN